MSIRVVVQSGEETVIRGEGARVSAEGVRVWYDVKSRPAVEEIGTGNHDGVSAGDIVIGNCYMYMGKGVRGAHGQRSLSVT